MYVVLSNGWLQLFIVVGGTFIPLLVDLVTKSTASATVKAVLNLVLVFVGAFITAVIAANNDGGLDWKAWLWTAVPAFVVSVAALFGFHMPTGIHAKAKAAITG